MWDYTYFKASHMFTCVGIMVDTCHRAWDLQVISWAGLKISLRADQDHSVISRKISLIS